MRYRTSPAFDHDFARLPRDHQALFRAAVIDHFVPAIAAGAFSGSPPWPRRLRIHRLADSRIWSMTWNFAAPDGRATFSLERSADTDEVALLWRRIGDHRIYRNP